MHQKSNTNHIPVLLDEVLEYLDPKSGETYLDMTAGYGGHASAILAMTKARAILVDRDKEAVDHLASKFKASKVKVIQNDFLTASRELMDKGQGVDLILADLGVSSPHLN